MKKLLLLCAVLFLALVPAGLAQIAVTEASIDLGTAGVDATTSATKTATFTTLDSVSDVDPLDYQDITFTGTAGTFTGTVTGSPTSLTAGSSVTSTVMVTVPAGTPAGSYTGTLRVEDGNDATNFDDVSATVVVSDSHDISIDDVEVSATYKNLDEDDSEVIVTKDITATNNGAFTESVTLSGVNFVSGVAPTFSESTFTLAPGASKTVTLTLKLTLDDGATNGLDSGISDVGDIKASYSGDQALAGVSVDLESMLEIDDVEVEIGDEDDKVEDGDIIDIEASPGEDVSVILSVENLFDKDYDFGDLKDVEVSITIDDDDLGDDVDEESDEFDIDAGDKEEDITISFTIDEDAEESKYDMVITAVGTDDFGGKHTITITVKLDVQVERDDVRIDSLDLTQSALQCSRETTLNVYVKNHGSDDQDDVRLHVDNSDLGIAERFQFELDEFGDRDDDARRPIPISVGDDVDAGTYPLEVRVFIDGDELDDDESVTLTVRDCSDEEDEESSVIIQPPAQPTAPTTETPATTDTPTGSVVFDSIEKPFIESPAFIALLVLGNLMVLGLIVFVIVKFAAK